MKMEKNVMEKSRVCAYCNEKVEDPNINFCPKCRNVLWFKPFREKRI